MQWNRNQHICSCEPSALQLPTEISAHLFSQASVAVVLDGMQNVLRHVALLKIEKAEAQAMSTLP